MAPGHEPDAEGHSADADQSGEKEHNCPHRQSPFKAATFRSITLWASMRRSTLRTPEATPWSRRRGPHGSPRSSSHALLLLSTMRYWSEMKLASQPSQGRDSKL